MKKKLALVSVCLLVTIYSGFVDAQQQGRGQQQRPVSAIAPASELFYRTFTATQLAQADQREPAQPAGRGAPAAMPNTANVLEEVFKRVPTLVVGVPATPNADGTRRPPIVLSNQREVFDFLNHKSDGRGAYVEGSRASGRQMSPQPTEHIDRLQRNLVALKVNIIICGNGITVNDPGMRFGDLSLAQDFKANKFPIYPNCVKCEAACPGICFMTAELNCRCYLEKLDPIRSAGPNMTEMSGEPMSRKLKEIAAHADNMLTNGQGLPVTDFDSINETIEIINGAFATELPFSAQDIVRWGGRDGGLVLSSVRPLSDVPFLVAEP